MNYYIEVLPTYPNEGYYGTIDAKFSENSIQVVTKTYAHESSARRAAKRISEKLSLQLS